MKWIPVDPSLDKDGKRLALLSLPLDRSKKVGVMTLDEGTELLNANLSSMQTSHDFAAEIGFGPFFSGSAKYESTVYFYDIMAWNQKLDIANPLDGYVHGTRWGIGMRIVVAVRKLDSKVRAGFASFAAAADYGMAEVYFSIATYGIGPEVIESFPDPRPLSVDAYAQLIGSMGGVKKALVKQIKDKTARSVPLAIYVKDTMDNPSDEVIRSRSFAIGQIRRRYSLGDAKDGGKKHGLLLEVIEDTYSSYGVQGDGSAPSSDASERAKRWLCE